MRVCLELQRGQVWKDKKNKINGQKNGVRGFLNKTTKYTTWVINNRIEIMQSIIENKQSLEAFRNTENTQKLFEKIEGQKVHMSGAAARTGTIE